MRVVFICDQKNAFDGGLGGSGDALRYDTIQAVFPYPCRNTQLQLLNTSPIGTWFRAGGNFSSRTPGESHASACHENQINSQEGTMQTKNKLNEVMDAQSVDTGHRLKDVVVVFDLIPSGATGRLFSLK